MSFDWRKTLLFEKTSNILNFSNSFKLKNQKLVNIYIPWNEKIENELMYKIRFHIKKFGSCAIPYMNLGQNNLNLESETIERIQNQCSLGHYETLLLMSNLNSIHIFRVRAVSDKESNRDILSLYKDFNYSTWFIVDDVFIFDVNHVDNEKDVHQKLEEFIFDERTQNVFERKTNAAKGVENSSKWISQNRNVTFDYFIKSSELADNIYQDLWKHFSRKTQHNLVMCELAKSKCVFLRAEERLESLENSFKYFKNALLSELNEIYIKPLIYTIEEYQILAEAWDKMKSGLVNKEAVSMIDKILYEDKDYIESLNDFLYFSKNIKSCFFTLKNQFSKKIFKEEHLYLENFINRIDSLFDSFNCKKIDTLVQSIIDIENEISKIMEKKHELSEENFKNINSKLSHLLSLMTSASYSENTLFKLCEEKVTKQNLKKTFVEEVREFLDSNHKKAS